MKTFKMTINSLCAYSLVASLIYGSFSPLYAAETTQKAMDILNVANQSLNMYGQYTVQKQQALVQQLQAQKSAKLMQQLSPGCKKSDGTFCHIVAGKVFPECPLSASISNFPQNVCNDVTTNGSKVSEMMTYENIANSWVNYYDHMSNKAGNGITSIGLQCLDEKKKTLDSSMTEMINNLTRLQDKLNKEREQFIANNKKITDQMDTLDGELNGSRNKNNLNAKTTDYKSLFSQSCQNIVSKDINAMITSGGLLGVNQSISAANKNAGNHNSNKVAIEKEIRTDVEKLAQVINRGGLANFLASQFTEQTQYTSINNAIKKQAGDFDISKKRIEAELKDLGYTLPAMSTNFSEDFAAFLSDSKTYFKKQYINNCTTGSDGSGIAIPTAQILSNLQQKSTNTGGTATAKYKAALENILNSDSFIQDKINRVKALESTYKDITVTYQSSNGQRITETPYDLLVKTITKCETSYAQSGMYTTSGNGEVSQAKKVERAQKALRELQSLHDNYSSNLANLALDQVLNCSGTAKKAGANCTEDVFNYKDASFCLAHASQCANEVMGCTAEINAQIKARQTKMDGLAKVYNNNMKSMVDNANKLYDLQKIAVTNLVKTIQEKVPGTNFEIPEDMFVKLPEMSSNKYGVAMINDGDMSFTAELPEKIALLKEMFTRQKAATLEEVNNYITNQAQAMNTQKGRWEKLLGQCTESINSSTQMMQDYNNSRMAAQDKEDQAIGSYCQKYNSLVNHPVGGCDQAKGLYETMNDVSSRLSNNAADYIANYQSVCNQYNNESSGTSSLDSICDQPAQSMPASTKTKCDEYNRNKLSDANSKAGKGSPARKIRIGSLCGSKSSPASEKDLIATLANKYAESDKEKLKTAKDLDELIKFADETDNVGILEFAEHVKGITKKGSVCKELLNLEDVRIISSDTSDSLQKSLSDKQAELKKLEDTSRATAAVAPSTTIPATTTATPATDNADKISSLNADIEKLKSKQSLYDLTQVMAGLIPPSPSEKQQMAQQFSRLGEQVSGDCDAQASNVGQQKGMPSFNLNTFDASILGTSR